MRIHATCSTRHDGLGWAEIDLPLVEEMEDRLCLRLPSGDTLEVGKGVSRATIDGLTYTVTVST